MAKINIGKFICDYYEEKKKKLPHGIMSGEVDIIERLLRSQNLEIHDGEIKEINVVKPPKWRKTYNNSTWSGEISVSPTERLFRYENYTINADELFDKLEKEE